MTDNHVAERWKQQRIYHNLTQTELADIAGLNTAIISLWERGKRTPQGQSRLIMEQTFHRLNETRSAIVSIALIDQNFNVLKNKNYEWIPYKARYEWCLTAFNLAAQAQQQSEV